MRMGEAWAPELVMSVSSKTSQAVDDRYVARPHSHCSRSPESQIGDDANTATSNTGSHMSPAPWTTRTTYEREET